MIQFRRIKVIPIILLILLVFLQYRLWFQSGGIFDMLHLKKQLVSETKKNDVLKQRNQKLLVEVEHLQKNQDAVEMRARQELGMIKKDETFYQVV